MLPLAAVAEISDEGDCRGAHEVEHQVFHGVLQGVAALERGCGVECAAGREKFLRVEVEDAVGNVFEYFPYSTGGHGEAYGP